MEILGNRSYVAVPGHKTHELPPLLLNITSTTARLDKVMQMAESIVESENLLSLPADERTPDVALEQRKFELALNLVEQYLKFVGKWSWGDSILGWIRQCQITFESEAALRNLLRPDLWPHAGRSSFVDLLIDKSIPTGGVVLENAVGLRLTFRQPPPIGCFSDQFLFYLNDSVAGSAYQKWAGLTEGASASLPPERFCFQVVNMAQ